MTKKLAYVPEKQGFNKTTITANTNTSIKISSLPLSISKR